MNSNINSGSLFHFTKTLGNLQSMLRQGLRFSYSFEHLWINEDAMEEVPTNSSNNTECGVAISMVSFCDIPLMRIGRHSAKYGKYAIGLDKEFLSDILYSSIMNPVLYTTSENAERMLATIVRHQKGKDNRMAKLINKHIQECGKDEQAILSSEEFEKERGLIYDEAFASNFLIGLSKPYGKKNSKGKFECYHEEREWRVFWPDGVDECTDWKRGITREYYNDNKAVWNKEIENYSDGYITIPTGYLYSAITHIIVKNEAQRKGMIKTIMTAKTIFGNKNVSCYERLFLISKITSLEQIEADY